MTLRVQSHEEGSNRAGGGGGSELPAQYHGGHALNSALTGRGVLILGAGIMQVPLIKKALAHKMIVRVMDINEHAPGVKLVPAEHFIHASIGDRTAAQRALLGHLAKEAAENHLFHTRDSAPRGILPHPSSHLANGSKNGGKNTHPTGEHGDSHVVAHAAKESGSIAAAESASFAATHALSGVHGSIEGVLTVGSDHTPTVAVLNETLKSFYKKGRFTIDQTTVALPDVENLSLVEALTASHKVQMREQFAKHGINQPKFFPLEAGMIRTIERTILQAEQFLGAYPFVLKPVDSMGSRGVKRIDNRSILSTSLHESLAFSRSEMLILETYLAGTELSLDAIIHKGSIEVRGIAERTIEYPPYFVETGHFMPPVHVSDSEIGLAVAEFEKAIRALNIVTGAAKGDIKICDGKAYIGEVAARLSGGFMSGWTTPLHLGVDMMQAILEVSFGLAPTTLTSLPREEQAVVCEWALLPGVGQIEHIRGLEQAKALPGVAEIFMHVTEGELTHHPQNNLMKAGNVITQAPTLAENRKIFEQVKHTLQFVLAETFS